MLKLEDSNIITVQMLQEKRHIDMPTKRHFSVLFQLRSGYSPHRLGLEDAPVCSCAEIETEKYE